MSLKIIKYDQKKEQFGYNGNLKIIQDANNFHVNVKVCKLKGGN